MYLNFVFVFVSLMMAEQGRNMSLNEPVVDLQLLFVCCVKMVQFNKFVTCAQRDGNNPIQILDIRTLIFRKYDVLFTDRCAAVDRKGRAADVTRCVPCMVTAVLTPLHSSQKTSSVELHPSYAIIQMYI